MDHPLDSYARTRAGGTIEDMRIDWRSPRVIGVAIALVVLAIAVSQGMFWSWEAVQYLEWGAVAVLVLVGAAAVKYLLQRKRD
jgi:D-alanyl-lipoteichoic acid acyltransferase DltB (MBOAT superfamily)